MKLKRVICSPTAKAFMPAWRSLYLVEPYSIDEQFLDVSGSLKLFGDSHDIAKQIKNQVMQEIGVRVRVGMRSRFGLIQNWV